MAKWASNLVLEYGVRYIRDNAIELRLISNYTLNDTYATVSSNTIVLVNTTPASYTISSQGNSVVLSTLANLSGQASVGYTSNGDLHVAFTNGIQVLWVTDETSNVAINVGNTIVFPQISYTVNQPT